MALTIGTDVSALNANNWLSKASKNKNSAMEKLSSGLRINKGADDPSGLIISELLRSQIGGYERALRNTQEASNVMSIAEGGLSSVSSMLTQMKGLAIHALNSGVTSDAQVDADQMEMNSLLGSINRVVTTTNYAGDNLLDGSNDVDADGAGGMQLQLGQGTGVQDSETVSIGNYNPANLGSVTVDGQAYSLNDLYGGGAASLANNPELALQVIDQAIADVSAGRASIGAYQANALDTNANNLMVAIENTTATESSIRDADMAEAITQYIKNKLLEQASLKGVQESKMNAGNVAKLLGAS